MRLGRRLLDPRHAHRGEGAGDVLRRVQHSTEGVGALLLQALPDGGDREVLRPDPATIDLLPCHRGGDRGARLRADRVDGRDVRPHPVHVVVDEHALPALHLPLHGHAIRIRLAEQPADASHELTHLRVGEARRHGHVDLHPRCAGDLRIGREAEPLACHAHEPRHGQHVPERGGRERVQVEEEIVGRVHGGAPGMEWVEFDAAEVRHEQKAGRVLDHEVIDDLVLGRSPPSVRARALHRAPRHPIRRV